MNPRQRGALNSRRGLPFRAMKFGKGCAEGGDEPMSAECCISLNCKRGADVEQLDQLAPYCSVAVFIVRTIGLAGPEPRTFLARFSGTASTFSFELLPSNLAVRLWGFLVSLAFGAIVWEWYRALRGWPRFLDTLILLRLRIRRAVRTSSRCSRL